MPLYPFIVLEVGSAFRVPTFRNYTLVNPQVGSPRDLGVRQREIGKGVMSSSLGLKGFVACFFPFISDDELLQEVCEGCRYLCKVLDELAIIGG
jgi:hypothetical protein